MVRPCTSFIAKLAIAYTASLPLGCEPNELPPATLQVTGSVALLAPQHGHSTIFGTGLSIVSNGDKISLAWQNGDVLGSQSLPPGQRWMVATEYSRRHGDVWILYNDGHLVRFAVDREQHAAEGFVCKVPVSKEHPSLVPLEHHRGSAWVQEDSLLSVKSATHVTLSGSSCLTWSADFRSDTGQRVNDRDGELYETSTQGDEFVLRHYRSGPVASVRDIPLFSWKDVPKALRDPLQRTIGYAISSGDIQGSPDRRALWIRFCDLHILRIGLDSDVPRVTAMTVPGMLDLVPIASDTTALVATAQAILRVEESAMAPARDWIREIEVIADRGMGAILGGDGPLFLLYAYPRVTVLHSDGGASEPLDKDAAMTRLVAEPTPALVVEDREQCVIIEFAGADDLSAYVDRVYQNCRGMDAAGHYIATGDTSTPEEGAYLAIKDHVDGERTLRFPWPRFASPGLHQDGKGVWMELCPVSNAPCETDKTDLILVRDVADLPATDLTLSFGDASLRLGDRERRSLAIPDTGISVSISEMPLKRPLGTVMQGLVYSLTVRNADGAALAEVKKVQPRQKIELEASLIGAGPTTLEVRATDHLGTDVTFRRTGVVFVHQFAGLWWLVHTSPGRTVLFLSIFLLSVAAAFLLRRIAPRVGPWLPISVLITGLGMHLVGSFVDVQVFRLPLAIGGPATLFMILVLAGGGSTRVQRGLHALAPFAAITPWFLRSENYRERWYAPFLAHQQDGALARGSIQRRDPDGVDGLLSERFVEIPATITTYPGNGTKLPDQLPLEPCLAHLNAGAASRARVVLIEGPGGLGKSALLRQILFASATQSKRSLLPVYCEGDKGGTVEDNLLLALGTCSTPSILRAELARGRILPVYDDVIGKDIAPDVFTTYLARGKQQTLLLSTRDHKPLREALARATDLLQVRPKPLAGETLKKFVARYVEPSELDRRLAAIEANLRDRDGTFLPIVVRLSTILPLKDDLRLTDIYADIFALLTHDKRPPVRHERSDEAPIDTLERIVMQDVWVQGLDHLDIETKSRDDQDTMTFLTDCGILRAGGPLIGHRPTLRRFFHDSARSYMVACGLRRGRYSDAVSVSVAVGTPDWDGIEEAAGAPEHRRSEIFDMVVAMLDEATVAEELTRRIEVWMRHVGSALGPDDVWNALPRACQQLHTERFGADMAPRGAVERAIEKLPGAGAAGLAPSRVYVQALAALFRGLASKVHDARSRQSRDGAGGSAQVGGSLMGALADLFLTVFDADELRRFIGMLPNGKDLQNRLPTGHPSLTVLADESARVIVQCDISDTALDLLLRLRPRRREWIETIRSRIPSEAPPPGTPRPAHGP